MNVAKMVTYTHREDLSAARPGDEVHVIKDDKEFVEDVNRLKDATDGSIIRYGGVRFARALLKNDLVDELHVDVYPLILGEGQPLFADLTERSNLQLKKTEKYDSGTVMLHYDLINT